MKTRLKQSENWLVQLQLLDLQMVAAYRCLEFEIAGIRCIKNSQGEIVFDCHREQLWRLGIELGHAFSEEHWSSVGVMLDPSDTEPENTTVRSPYTLIDFHHHFVTAWMADAILDQKLVCHRQPIVSANDMGQTVAHEYFLHHETEDGKSVDARELFAFAHRYGLHENLHWASIENCLPHCFDHQADQTVLINVDPAKFYRSEYHWNEILESVSENAYEGHRIAFEISTKSMTDPRMAASFASRVRQYGFQVALDEWGQENNSIHALDLVRPDYVKISRKLTSRAPHDIYLQKLIAGMVATAKDLEMLVIAEGIQSREQRDWAVDSGFDWIQGQQVGASVRAQKSHSRSGLFLRADDLNVEYPTSIGGCQ